MRSTRKLPLPDHADFKSFAVKAFQMFFDCDGRNQSAAQSDGRDGYFNENCHCE